MGVLALHSADPPPELIQLLDLAGYVWKQIDHDADVDALEPDEGWGGAIVHVAPDPDRAWSICRSLTKRPVPVEPVLVIIRGNQLADLELRDDLFSDFCLDPFHPRELEARVARMQLVDGILPRAASPLRA